MDNMDKYVGRILDDRYELKEIIGTGGMAVVFKAMDHRLKRMVAVKILREELFSDEEFRSRFQTESQAVAMLSHPNIVAVYDVSRSRETEYIVMELLDGVTLKQDLREKGALSWEEVLDFSEQIASALSHAHSKGLVHRDIKPQNLMLLPDGTIKVADFGIADLHNEVSDGSGEAIGSVHYISPEQARGLAVDERSDLYSLGVVMYEMLSGALPFDNEDELKIPLMHLSTIPKALSEYDPDIPEEMIRITMKAMEPDRNARYQTAEELLEDLELFRESAQRSAEPVSVPQNPPVPEKITGNVEPLGNNGELSREKYRRRARRARTVSMLSGIFGVLLFILMIGVFLWNYWLRDLFSVAQRIDIPDFVGSNYESIINSGNYSRFNFTCVFQITPDTPEGEIVSQKPEANKSYMLTDSGIDVELTISTGIVMNTIPNFVNYDYMESSVELEKMGYKVEKIFENNDDITAGYVISISPNPGEKLPAGSTVYLVVSNGPDVKTVVMPNLVGKTRWAATDQLEALNLNLMPVIYVSSDEYAEGFVISQTVDAGLEVEVHTKVYLTVSTGPEKTPETDNWVVPID